MKGTTSAFRRRLISLEAYQPSVDQFWRRFGINPSGQQVLQPTAAVPPPPAATVAPVAPAPAASVAATTASVADRLENLAKLRADGVLTEDEFIAAKRRLLGL